VIKPRGKLEIGGFLSWSVFFRLACSECFSPLHLTLLPRDCSKVLHALTYEPVMNWSVPQQVIYLVNWNCHKHFKWCLFDYISAITSFRYVILWRSRKYTRSLSCARDFVSWKFRKVWCHVSSYVWTMQIKLGGNSEQLLTIQLLPLRRLSSVPLLCFLSNRTNHCGQKRCGLELDPKCHFLFCKFKSVVHLLCRTFRKVLPAHCIVCLLIASFVEVKWIASLRCNYLIEFKSTWYCKRDMI